MVLIGLAFPLLVKLSSHKCALFSCHVSAVGIKESITMTKGCMACNDKINRSTFEVKDPLGDQGRLKQFVVFHATD